MGRFGTVTGSRCFIRTATWPPPACRVPSGRTFRPRTTKSVEELATLQETDYFQQVDTVTVGRVLPSVGTHFDGAFGTPFDPRRFNRDNVFTILAQQIDARATLPAIYLTCGDDDSFNLWRGAVALYDTAIVDELSDVQLRIIDGDHVWSLWAVEIVPVLRFIDRRWEQPSSP
jgi:enterochelin esterase family protein